MNKRRNFWAEQEHNDHGYDYGSDHDFYIFGSTACSDDTVKRKNSIDQHDLADGLAE